MDQTTTVSGLDVRIPLAEMHKLRRDYHSIDELAKLRDFILQSDILSAELNEHQASKLTAAESKAELFHALFGYWARQLARTKLIVRHKDADELIRDLFSDDTRDAVRAYHFALDEHDRLERSGGNPQCG